MKKESYRHNLPHFQQPGQAFFVTWILKDAVPPKAFPKYSNQLQQLKNQIELQKQQKSEKNIIEKLQKENFDTTIRDEKHLYNAVEYTLNNPVNAGLVKNRNDWPGNYLNSAF